MSNEETNNVDSGPVEDSAPVEVENSASPAPEPAPEPKSPPTEAEIDAAIEFEIGQFIDAFRAEHAGAYRAIKARLGHPLEFEITGLVRDQVYAQLLANTDEAVDLGQIVKAIAEIVLNVVGRFLPMLG